MQKLMFSIVLAFLVLGLTFHAPVILAEEGSKIKGTVEFVDVEGGCWKITAEDGTSYEPINLGEGYKEDGLSVEFEGEVKTGMASTCQVGTLILITKISTRAELFDSDDSDDSEENESEDETEDEVEDSDKDDEDESKTRERIRETIVEGNCTIKAERTTVFEDGKRIIGLKKTIVCADGRKAEIKIKIENRTEDGRFREKIKYEFEGKDLEIEAEEGIDLEEDANTTEYKLTARLRNNATKQIKIMPDTASEVALERLRAKNFTIELREKTIDNVPGVVYHVRSDKEGRFLGIFKLKMEVEGEVDAETGEFLGESKPWWAFLVSGEGSDQTEADADVSGGAAGTVETGSEDAEGNWTDTPDTELETDTETNVSA